MPVRALRKSPRSRLRSLALAPLKAEMIGIEFAVVNVTTMKRRKTPQTIE
jgi:hypothetical protein